jgi:nucleoside-diphosphate-sugar epimerase
MPAPSDETILITGASGFTGRLLKPRLEARGCRVVGLDRSNAACPVDLRDGAAVSKLVCDTQPDVVLHLGGITTNQFADIPAMYAINVVGTAHLYAALASQPKRPRLVIHASSVTVYAPPAATDTLSEDCPLRPFHHYGASKLAAEELARQYLDKLPILITRPFNYTGPGQSDSLVIAKIVRHFRERADEMRMGDLSIARDFSDIEDVLEIYERLMALGSAGQIVNIASGEATSLRSVVETLTALTGHPMRIIEDPRFMRAGEPKVLRGAVQRLNEIIGPMPRRPLGETLERMLRA